MHKRPMNHQHQPRLLSVLYPHSNIGWLLNCYRLSQRTALSIREPRKKLPLEIAAIKRSMKNMQKESSLQSVNPLQPFSFISMIFFITFMTYFVCYMAMDPDHLAELRAELKTNGLKSMILALFDFGFEHEGGDDDECDDDDDDDDGDEDGDAIQSSIGDHEEEFEYVYIYEDVHEDGTIVRRDGPWTAEAP